jgi:nitrite reductase/ring-hydroxylating ferredoxin subunit
MKVAKKKDVAEGVPFCAVFEKKSIALFNVGGTYYAIDNTCTHMGGPLCQGALRGDVVQCPWHGSKFDVKSGKIVRGPAEKPVKQYKVQVDGEDIQVTE